MIRPTKETDHDGVVGTRPSIISGRQINSKMRGVSDNVAAGAISLILRQKDLSHAGFRLATFVGATMARMVGPASTEQSVTVN
jgi:hypothetical protein